MKIRLNENEELVRMIRAGLIKKEGHCPCKLQMSDETICLCEEFRNQINDPDFEGYCHCMLYYKEK